MIPANLKPEWKIKEKDQGFYNMLFTRITVTTDPKRPITTERVKCLRESDYLKYFVRGKEADRRDYRESMAIDAAELIHDPSKVDKEQLTKITNEPVPGPKTKLNPNIANQHKTPKQKLQDQALALGIKGIKTKTIPELRNAIKSVKK